MERPTGISDYYWRIRQALGHERMLVPGVAAVIHDEAGRLLLVRSKAGGWGLPAGALEPGERPSEALVREVREETGLAIQVDRLLAVLGGPERNFTYANGDRVTSLVAVFAVTVLGGEARPDMVEIDTVRWFALDALPELPFSYPAEVLAGTAVGAFD